MVASFHSCGENFIVRFWAIKKKYPQWKDKAISQAMDSILCSILILTTYIAILLNDVWWRWSMALRYSWCRVRKHYGNATCYKAERHLQNWHWNIIHTKKSGQCSKSTLEPTYTTITYKLHEYNRICRERPSTRTMSEHFAIKST